MRKIIQVVGARPNFMKVAPVHRALKEGGRWESQIVHTGQHQDVNMSDIFFKQLNLDLPKHFLGVQPGSHSQMTAGIMQSFEKVLQLEKPDWVVVVGDVTSTLACALTSVRCSIPVAHVEAGLRSFDRQMPEEINRLLTDQLSDLLFTTENSAAINLAKENIAAHKIRFVGNCMIDSLIYFLPNANASSLLKQHGLEQKDYAVMTMHRPSNVDYRSGLEQILDMIRYIVSELPLVFPVHPRTEDRLRHFGLWEDLKQIKGLILTPPLAYLDFIGLMKNSKMLLTDSGGIQEETTYLKIPCLTFRKTTERPITTEMGSNILISDLNVENACRQIYKVLQGNIREACIPEMWDGQAGQRIANVFHEI